MAYWNVNPFRTKIDSTIFTESRKTYQYNKKKLDWELNTFLEKQKIIYLKHVFKCWRYNVKKHAAIFLLMAMLMNLNLKLKKRDRLWQTTHLNLCEKLALILLIKIKFAFCIFKRFHIYFTLLCEFRRENYHTRFTI